MDPKHNTQKIKTKGTDYTPILIDAENLDRYPRIENWLLAQKVRHLVFLNLILRDGVLYRRIEL